MVYLLPYLYYPPPEGSFYSEGEAIVMALSAYFCTTLFFVQFIWTLYNTWHYLIKQRKWRVFSLTMFYLFSIVCIFMRIVDTVLSVQIGELLNCFMILYPAVMKICIGIV